MNTEARIKRKIERIKNHRKRMENEKRKKEIAEDDEITYKYNAKRRKQEKEEDNQ